jgi:hypothetical protein
MKMKKKLILFLVVPALLFAGSAVAGKPKADLRIKQYLVDLDGNGNRRVVEVEDKTATDSISVVSVKNKKKGETIDSFSIPGKIRKIEFRPLHLGQQQRIIVHFDEKDGPSDLVIYQLKNEKLSKIFFASSAYGIETDFDLVARVRIGKAPLHNKSPNLIPEWDTWIWAGDKFIKE